MTFSGLINFGNICFFNVSVQLLMSICPLVEKLRLNEQYTSFISDFENKLRISAVPFYKDFISIDKDYKPHHQADALECLGYLLDMFRHEFFEIQIIQTSTRISSNEKTINRFSETILNIKLCESLPLGLTDYFEENTEEFIIKKQLINLPEYLIISTKRFENNGNKISDPSEIPPFLEIDNISYILIGFILHLGDQFQGHYIYCRFIEGKWVIFDDDKIIPVELSHAVDLISRGYIYLYHQIPTPDKLE